MGSDVLKGLNVPIEFIVFLIIGAQTTFGVINVYEPRRTIPTPYTTSILNHVRLCDEVLNGLEMSDVESDNSGQVALYRV